MMQIFEVSVEQAKARVEMDPITLDFALHSAPLLISLWNDEPTSLFGLIPLRDQIGAYLWMETLPGTYLHPTATIRHSREVIRRGVAAYQRIIGHCETAEAIAWFKFLGAKFEDDTPGILQPFEIN